MRSCVGVVVLAVVAAACTPDLPDDLPSLVEFMGANDMVVNTAAARKVVAQHGVDGLLVALQSPNPGARLQAARFLRLHPDAKAIVPLLAATTDPDPTTRSWVTFALSAFPTPEVEQRLKELLVDPHELVRRRAAEALEILKGRHGAAAAEQ